MGMHFGFIVAAAPWPSLRGAVEEDLGRLTELGDVPEAEWFDPPAHDGAVLVAESEGRAYLLDRELVLSTDPDLVVRLSQRLGGRVVGAGVESASGTVWFIAAESGSPRRVHFDTPASSPDPFELGDPLAGEEVDEWADSDGAGVFAALAAYGFDPAPLTEGPPDGGQAYTYDGNVIPPAGELGRRLGAHFGTPGELETARAAPPRRRRRLFRRG